MTVIAGRPMTAKAGLNFIPPEARLLDVAAHES